MNNQHDQRYRRKFLHPIDDTVEWFKSAVNFGYRSFILAADIALIYGAIYIGSHVIKGCSCSHNEGGQKTGKNTSVLENIIGNEKTYVIGPNIKY